MYKRNGSAQVAQVSKKNTSLVTSKRKGKKKSSGRDQIARVSSKVILKRAKKKSGGDAQITQVPKKEIAKGAAKKKVGKKGSKDAEERHKKPLDSKLGIVKAVVKHSKGFYLYVELNKGIKGRIHITEISDKVSNGSRPLTAFHRGQILTVKRLGVSSVRSHSGLVITRAHVRQNFVDCSLRLSDVGNSETPCNRMFSVGNEVVGYICEHTNIWVYMWISPTVKGRIHLLNLSTNFKKIINMKKHFKIGHAFHAHIIGRGNRYFELSIIRPKDLRIGAAVPGRVLSTRKDLGLLLKLPLGHIGRVHLTDMCDEYKHSAIYMADFVKDKIVKCVILSIDSTTKNAAVSLRVSRTDGLKDSNIVVDKEYEWADMEIHKELRGYVSGIAKMRIFVAVARNVLAVCPIRPGIPAHLKSLGAVVRIKITKLEEDNRLQGNVLVTDEDLVEPTISIPEEVPVETTKRSIETRPDKNSIKRNKKPGRASRLKDVSSAPIGDSVEKVDAENKELTHLQLPMGFVWDLSKIPTGNDNNDSSDDEDDGVKTKSNKKRRTKFLEEKSEEDRLRQTELMLLDSSRQPETVDDFDRMVLGSPNSSIIWLKYMAFHLQSTEIDKARTVAERALKTISFREEQEKLNVWVALLNLENLYGTEESMQKVFQRALQYNDPIKVYKHVVNIYIQSDKRELAEKIYGTMLKKFPTNIEVRINYGIFLMKNGQHGAAHNLMDRSLKSLPKKDHLSLISKFAQLEFKYGDCQRANTLFESMLASYPKRADIWSVYVDVLVKTGDIEKARDIYKKVITMAATNKKMKFFYQKYVDFERIHGDENSLAHAREMLLEIEQSGETIPIMADEDE